MSPDRVIYLIHQSKELLKAWRELSKRQKQSVVKACAEIENETEIEKIIDEIACGQRRLF